jgi:hypothetical protein
MKTFLIHCKYFETEHEVLSQISLVIWWEIADLYYSGIPCNMYAISVNETLQIVYVWNFVN